MVGGVVRRPLVKVLLGQLVLPLLSTAFAPTTPSPVLALRVALAHRMYPGLRRLASSATITMHSVQLPVGLDSAPAESKMVKVHSSTCALIPPEEAWGQLQALRYQLEDSGLYRWPPHVNVYYISLLHISDWRARVCVLLLLPSLMNTYIHVCAPTCANKCTCICIYIFVYICMNTLTLIYM